MSRKKHNAVQRQLRLRYTLMYADYVKRTFVQHIEILSYVLTLNPASVLIKMNIRQEIMMISDVINKKHLPLIMTKLIKVLSF